MQMRASLHLDLRNRPIVNTSSVYGVIGNPQLSLYIASKHAVLGLTKAAARIFKNWN
jgi:NAD(P)-dependent dehydrogenase (short-subunit alcohol dehydrogenase family)